MPAIQSAERGKAADHGNHFWDLKLDDGRVAWGLFKHDIEVGEEVVVAYEKDGKLRVKRPEAENQGGQPGRTGGKSYEADPKKLRSENARSALHAAKDLVAYGKLDLSMLGEYTKRFYSYIDSVAKVDE